MVIWQITDRNYGDYGNYGNSGNYGKYGNYGNRDSPSFSEATPWGSELSTVNRVSESWINAVEGIGKKLP